MIRPTPRSLTLQLIGFLLLVVLLIFAPALWLIWLVYIGIVVALTLLDAVILPSKNSLQWSWNLPGRVYLEEGGEARFELRNLSTRQALDCRLAVEVSGSLSAVDPIYFRAAPQRASVHALPLHAWRRGRGGFSKMQLRWQSKLGLLERRTDIPSQGVECDATANLRAVQRAGMQWRNAKQYLQGLKVQKHIGDGREFDALREFQPGHDSRAIDWRASARMRELHVREFREEKNHNIILAFDTGRLMARNLDALSRLDHALNAALHLSYVSLQAGDRVGLYGFDRETRRWLPPSAGAKSLNAVMDAMSALPYTLNVTDFRSAFTFLDEKLKRRSIVVLFTDFEGEQGGDNFLRYLRPLSRKHLVLVVAVGDNGELSVAKAPTNRLADLQTAVASAHLQQQRLGALRALNARGIRSIDVPPERIALQLLHTYHDVKRRGLV